MRLVSIAVAWIISVLTLLLLAGHSPWAGPLLVGVGDTHGLKVGDLPVLGLWLAGMVCSWFLWRWAEP